jgi:DNA-binding GntR family transcriptional regulator
MRRPRQRTRASILRNGKTSLAEQVFRSIKRDIVEHRLPPETILAEATIAERYGVSRAPAREALKRLATFGFVRVVHRVGYIVTGVRVRDFDEIFALRLALEPLAVELAVPRMTDRQAAQLDRLARQVLEIPASPPDERGALTAQLNADFHREISRIADNSRLQRTIRGLIDELERFMHTLAYSDAVSSLLNQHLTLVETMRTGDPRAAAQLMRDQLANDYVVMRELILSDISVLALDTPAAPNP